MSENAPFLLPFSHLNLRFNPFGELTPDERGLLAVPRFDLDRVVENLRDPGFAIQFIGKRGCGKSSQLFAIRHHFPGMPYTYIPEEGPIPAIPQASIVFIDEMQRIPRIRRSDILKRKASFVICSETNHAREFKRARLTFEIVKITGLTVALLRKVTDKRINWARRSRASPVPWLADATLSTFIAKYGDDVRAIEAELYERLQSQTEVGEIRF